MGCIRRCDLMAMKEHASETSPARYFRCCVIDELRDLPDGHYTVTFPGYKVRVTKEAGLWLPSEDVASVDPERKRLRVDRPRESDTVDGLLAILRKYTV